MSTDGPLVSVVVPVWDGDNAAHFREAIASLLAQTETDIETIVVLDGHVSPEIVAWMDGLSSVRYVSVEGGPAGASAARNCGVASARGTYIAFLDADDVALPQRIERQRMFLEREALDLCGCCYRVMDYDGRIESERRVPIDAEAIRRYAGVMNPIGCSMMFGKAELFRDHPFDKSIRYGEDYDLNTRLLRAGRRMANQAEYLVNVRAGQGFLSRRRGWEPFRSDLRNRWRGVGLAPWWFRPAVALGAFVLVTARLMPRPLLRLLYALRARLRFGE